MSILVYAISRDDARAPAAGELQEICAAGLRALAEPVEEPLSADLEQLVRYEEKVETVMRSHTILPMRFGSVVDEEEVVRELLKSRAREFMTALTHLDGAVEFGVHVSAAEDPATSRDPDATAQDSGAAYMRARLTEQRRRDELRSWLTAALDGVVRECVCRTTPLSGPESVSAAVLVDREAEDRFVEFMEELAQRPERTLSWSGPWPPYTFVEGLEA